MADQNAYAYNDANGNRGVIEAGNVYFTGTWAASTMYAPLNSATYGVSSYIANGSNAGIIPRGASLAAWSPLVLIYTAGTFTPEYIQGPDGFYWQTVIIVNGNRQAVLNGPIPSIPTSD